MKTRVRFVVAHLGKDIDDVAEAFNLNPYKENLGIGIESNFLDTTGLSATFIEKKRVYDEVNYPNGEIEQLERIKYVYVDFKIIILKDLYYLIKIDNPPTSLKSFINYLLHVIPTLTIEKYQFDLKKFYVAIKSNSNLARCQTIRLKASSIPFSDKSVARLEIVSENDAYQELKKVYGDDKYKLERLVFSLMLDGVTSFLTIASTGTANFDSEAHGNIVIESFVKSISF